MNVDNRLTLPVALLLAALECSFARVGRAASAIADVFAAARWQLDNDDVPSSASTRRDGIADVIVLSNERKHER